MEDDAWPIKCETDTFIVVAYRFKGICVFIKGTTQVPYSATGYFWMWCVFVKNGVVIRRGLEVQDTHPTR